MTQDSRTQRTPAVDNEAWSPFGGLVHETTSSDGTVDADVRPSTVRADAAGWRPVVIEGGRGHVAERDAAEADEGGTDTAAADAGTDVLDAAAADALAILDAPGAGPAAEAVEPEPAPAPVEETPAPAAAPETARQAAVAPAQEATPHPTLHTPDQATPEAPAPAQSHAEAADTPHSTPWWKHAVGWLNPYEILDQPLPPVSAIYEAASTTVTDRTGFDRITEIAWVYAIGMPITVACYTIAAAVQHKARGIGVGLTVLAWVLAADSAPVDASVIWWWTAIGYWVSTTLILPAVIQAKK